MTESRERQRLRAGIGHYTCLIEQMNKERIVISELIEIRKLILDTMKKQLELIDEDDL